MTAAFPPTGRTRPTWCRSPRRGRRAGAAGPAAGPGGALAGALGCVLATDVAAAEDLPPFANSAMDGFAVRGADLTGAGEDHPVALEVTGEVFAGTGRLPTVEPGAAARIMTGGACRRGRTRWCRSSRPRSTTPCWSAPTPAGPVRARGRRGRPPGHRGAGAGLADPAAIGMLASVGRRNVPVHPRPRVMVVSTGDELVDPASRWGRARSATPTPGCWSPRSARPGPTPCAATSSATTRRRCGAGSPWPRPRATWC